MIKKLHLTVQKGDGCCMNPGDVCGIVDSAINFFLGIIGVGFSKTTPRRGHWVWENIFCKNSAKWSITSSNLVAIEDLP